MKQLIERVADVNGSGSRTILHDAVLHCGGHMIKFLLKIGANAHALDYQGRTAMEYAEDGLVPIPVLQAFAECGVDVDQNFARVRRNISDLIELGSIPKVVRKMIGGL